MLSTRHIALGAAMVAAVAVTTTVTTTVTVTAKAGATGSDCAITSPPEGWPNGGIRGYNTRLHRGINNDWANQLRPVGDVKVIMLFVDFPNATAGGNSAPYHDTRTYYNNLVNGSTEFFRTSSYGQFRLAVDAPQRWYRMSKRHEDYGFTYLMPPERQSVYIDEAMRLADNDIDFSQYQAVYVVPPRNASTIRWSPEWNDYRGVVKHDGKVFKNGVTFGQDAWSWGYKILNHETGHDMGLPEDYNATGVGPTFKFTGGWGVMGNIGGHSPDLFAWEKWKMGWLTDDQIACVRGTSTVTVEPIERPGGTKAVVVRTGTYTAWVAEVRQRTGVNANACDKGVLVYRIDASKPNGDGTLVVTDAHPATSVCGDSLNDAAFDLGAGEVAAFTDSATKTRIELLSTANGAYTLRVSTGSGTPVYGDDFEADRGWTVNPAGTDTATAGRWERGDPEATVYSGQTYQRGDTTSGVNGLVTGRLAGPDAGTYDVDGGTTSIRSPEITLPADGTLTLSLRLYFAHADNATSADYLRVTAVGTTTTQVYAATGAAVTRPATWGTVTADLTALRGQTIRLLVVVADDATGSLVEAGLDDVTITRQ